MLSPVLVPLCILRVERPATSTGRAFSRGRVPPAAQDAPATNAGRWRRRSGETARRATFGYFGSGHAPGRSA